MKNKKLLIFLGAAISLIAFLLILEAMNVINLRQKTPDSSQSQGPTTEQKQQDAEINADIKKQLIEEAPDNNSGSDNAVTGKSIELSARQETNNTVTVFTKLRGFSDGSCELTIANGTKTNTQSASVIYQPEFSSCAGFSVPIDSLGKGSWIMRLSVTSGGSTETKTLTFEVK